MHSSGAALNSKRIPAALMGQLDTLCPGPTKHAAGHASCVALSANTFDDHRWMRISHHRWRIIIGARTLAKGESPGGADAQHQQRAGLGARGDYIQLQHGGGDAGRSQPGVELEVADRRRVVVAACRQLDAQRLQPALNTKNGTWSASSVCSLFGDTDGTQSGFTLKQRVRPAEAPPPGSTSSDACAHLTPTVFSLHLQITESTRSGLLQLHHPSSRSSAGASLRRRPSMAATC